MTESTLLIFLMLIPLSMEGRPGTLFWKPRLAINLARHPPALRYATGLRSNLKPPTPWNIKEGYVIILDGYNIGITFVAIATVIDIRTMFDHLNPTRASYYTNMYRWAVRHLSLYPDWLSGKGEGYPVTHRVWIRRYFYNDWLVPGWLQKLLPFVTEADWKKEAYDLKQFNKYAEPAFGKLNIYPSKYFRNYQSQHVKNTIENIDKSDLSIKKP